MTKIEFFKMNLMDEARRSDRPEYAKDVHGAPAWGISLFSDELEGPSTVGMDMIHMRAGEDFPHHTHPGHHVLIMIRGKATVTYDGVIHSMRPWDYFVIPGSEVHNVGCIEDCTFLAAGWPKHEHLDSPRRMTVVEKP